MPSFQYHRKPDEPEVGETENFVLSYDEAYGQESSTTLATELKIGNDLETLK